MGLNKDCFISYIKSYSVRGAATSKANLSGVPIHDILKVAGWANEKTFARFYNKPLQLDQNNFDEAVST